MAKKLYLKRYWGNDRSQEAFLLCKLIPLDVNPGVRPIGIREVIGRILGCAVMRSYRKNVLEKVGDLQLHAGQHVGCETAVHPLSSLFSGDDSDMILLVDVDNAFNQINQNIMLHNI